MPNNSKQIADYKNASVAIPKRVADLLSRMTLEEKAAQMLCVWNGKLDTLLNDQGKFDQAKAIKCYGHGNGIGQIGRPGDTNEGASPVEFAELTNEIQRFFVENSRLGIPVLFHDECLHGLVANDATSFPQPIALASTFNPHLVQRVFELVAREARAVGVHQALAPVLDVARDPRWGRVEETFGEDPYLVSEIGLAAVLGFQGEEPIADRHHVLATLKHFAAHGQPEGGNNCGPVSLSERHLREICLYPFERAVCDGRAQSVMASYNEIDGIPSHASKWLLRQVLRDEWDFGGTVVSDYYAIRELWDRPDLYGHHVAADREEAAVLAARAGVNIELPEPDCYEVLPQLIRRGRLLEEQLDELVRPLLTQKFELGLFDNPYVDTSVADSCLGSVSHRELALEAANQAITLLKNEGGILPLNLGKLRTIAVIGPNAHRCLLGGYSGKPRHFTTVLEGLQSAIGNAVELLYTAGCEITINGSWYEDEVTPSDPEKDGVLIAEATDLAKKADLAILAVGGNEQTSREAWMSNHLGDRTSLDMVGRQDDLVNAIADLGKPMVALLFNGRPLAVDNLVAKSKAVLECWYLGQESGTAIANILLGKQNPAGKLPISIPRSAGHIPAFYNFRPSARRGYLFDDVSPLFPFGYGLSYTTFAITQPTLTKPEIDVDESTAVQFEVTNTGDLAGTEVVQLYIRDLVSSATRPVHELKGFIRVFLEPGESRKVTMDITSEHLAFWNVDMEYIVEPGEFELQIGPNSIDLQSCKLTVVS